MADTITLAIDALASAAFIEGGVSIERTDEARQYTEQRKRELLEAIATSQSQAVAAQAAPAAVAVPETRESLAQRLDAACDSLEAIKLPPHNPTYAIEDILDEYEGDEREEAWESIKAYAEGQARGAVLIERKSRAATPALPATGDSSEGDLTEVPAREFICPTKTVADLVNNLLLLDQSLPIYGAQYIDHPERKRCAIAVEPTISRERVKDGRWIDQGDELNAVVIWTRAAQPSQAEVQAEPVAWINHPVIVDCAGNFAGYGNPELSFKRPASGLAFDKAQALYTAPQAQPADAKVQWWLAEIDRYGNPTLTDGAHGDRAAADRAAYLIESMGLGKGRKFAVARVELTKPVPNSSGVNHDAVAEINRAAMAAAQEGGNAATEA